MEQTLQLCEGDKERGHQRHVEGLHTRGLFHRTGRPDLLQGCTGLCILTRGTLRQPRSLVDTGLVALSPAPARHSTPSPPTAASDRTVWEPTLP